MKLQNTKIIEKSNNDARKYFLKHKAYFTTDLPPYFSFTEILEKINDYFENKKIDDIEDFSEKITGDNKYTILTNKNQYNYRPISLIDPVLYVYLVHIITEEKKWQQIQKRFEEFAKYSKINCHSLPIYTDDKNKLNATIKHWLSEVERESLTNSLEYNFLFKTDISNCYSSIYTHSISWALHGKEGAKNNRFDKSLLGNQIDKIMRLISNSQTNGIPQGSILMDFIAEIVLFYLDKQISVKIKNQEISDFKIIRWRRY